MRKIAGGVLWSFESFDPYHRWLGISPKHQPADYYRLLGIEQFESDLEVIRDGADRQMAHVRTYQLGKYSALSQQILNELAAARACLRDPARKAAKYSLDFRRQRCEEVAPGQWQYVGTGRVNEWAPAGRYFLQNVDQFVRNAAGHKADPWTGEVSITVTK